jgi:quercetin dioxygenase-like cupin family protein
VINRYQEGSWKDVDVDVYKDEPGTWMAVTRRVFEPESNTLFDTRYFEVAAGGYTSFEKHQHEHMVVVLRGRGRVRLGDDWHDIAPFDVIRVESSTPHQFTATEKETLGILCIVNRDRDRPELLRSDQTTESSNE